MSESSVFPYDENAKLQVGKRVSIGGNNGTIRYLGAMQSASGLWCGIELDKALGDNDGKVNNARYFSCKENHGLFLPIPKGTIIDGEKKKYFNVLADDGIQKEKIDIETQRYDEPTAFPFIIISALSTLPETIAQKNLHNESLTISENYIDQFSIKPEEKFESSVYSELVDFPCVEQVGLKEWLDKEEVIENIQESYEPVEETEMPHEDLEKNSDSTESLGILPNLLDDEISLNELLLDVNEPIIDLNSTVILSNSAECKTKSAFNANKFIVSPVCIMSTTALTKSTESFICSPSMPTLSSTPKRDIYEKCLEIPASKENVEYILPVTVNTLTPISDENEDPGQNTFNITGTVFDPVDTEQPELNKTFDNPNILKRENFFLPQAVEILKTVDFDTSDSCFYKEGKNICFEDQNILNKTCEIIKIPGKILEQEDIAKNVLNKTLSFPVEVENKFESHNEETLDIHKKAGFLNTTYEKADEPSKLRKFTKIVESSDQCDDTSKENLNLQTISKSKAKPKIPLCLSHATPLNRKSKDIPSSTEIIFVECSSKEATAKSSMIKQNINVPENLDSGPSVRPKSSTKRGRIQLKAHGTYQESLLNKTINLTTSTSDVKKPKKRSFIPRFSSKIDMISPKEKSPLMKQSPMIKDNFKKIEAVPVSESDHKRTNDFKDKPTRMAIKKKIQKNIGRCLSTPALPEATSTSVEPETTLAGGSITPISAQTRIPTIAEKKGVKVKPSLIPRKR